MCDCKTKAFNILVKSTWDLSYPAIRQKFGKKKILL
jgi:hypothetical protein